MNNDLDIVVIGCGSFGLQGMHNFPLPKYDDIILPKVEIKKLDPKILSKSNSLIIAKSGREQRRIRRKLSM